MDRLNALLRFARPLSDKEHDEFQTLLDQLSSHEGKYDEEENETQTRIGGVVDAADTESDDDFDGSIDFEAQDNIHILDLAEDSDEANAVENGVTEEEPTEALSPNRGEKYKSQGKADNTVWWSMPDPIETARAVRMALGRRTVAYSRKYFDSKVEAFKRMLNVLIISKIVTNRRTKRTYESHSRNESSPFYRAVTIQRRFEQLTIFLRFDDQRTRAARLVKLAAFRYIWTLFLPRLNEEYLASKELTIDEQLVACRGRCSFRLYILQKPGKYKQFRRQLQPLKIAESVLKDLVLKMESSKETTSMDTETTKSFLSSATTTSLSHKMIVDQAEMSAISMTQQQEVSKNSKDISISLRGSVQDNESTVAAISDDVLKSDMNLIQKMTDMNIKGNEIMNIDDSIEDSSERKKSQLSEENQSSLISSSMKSSILAMSDQSATVSRTQTAYASRTESAISEKKMIKISSLTSSSTSPSTTSSSMTTSSSSSTSSTKLAKISAVNSITKTSSEFTEDAKQTNEAIDNNSSDDTVTETIVVIKKEVEISETPNENIVTIENCPENGDEDDAEVFIIGVVKHQISDETENEKNENEVEKPDEKEKTNEIEKESVTDTTPVQETVERAPDGTTTTITTVKVVKKQIAPSAENTDSSDAESITTTTTVTKKEIKPIMTETGHQNDDDDDVDGCTTTTTINTVITATQPTSTIKKQADESTEPKTLNDNVEVSGDNGVDDDDDLEELEKEEEEEEVDEAEKESEPIITTKTRQQQQMTDSTDATQTKDTTSQDGPSQIQTKSVETHQENIDQQLKKNNIDATIKEIISDIDSNIRDQEHIANLKQQEQELLRKQQQLAQQIQQQQLLAQKLADENIRLQQQQLLRTQQQQQQQQQQELQIPQHLYRTADTPNQNVSKYSTYEKIEDENGYKCETTESYETSESTNTSKKVDLHKIFTPAADANEILPRNRKLYASSAFYSPTLHPTVEDQVELARRISHSLSDKSNQKSKGQSMYVNRKKRSVKWVHEGQGQEQDEYQEEFKENQSSSNGLQNDYTSTIDGKDKINISSSADYKIPLRLLMNPFGQMRDYNSLRESINIETGLLSPDKCAELVAALKTQKSRGAELFAKRRKKSDKWIVDECSNIVNSTSAIAPTTFTNTPSNTNNNNNNSTGIESLNCGNLTDFHQYQPKPPTSPSIVPAYSDAGKHRVQLNMHQEQILEKYAKPSLKVIKTPWEAALETGSASAAFVERAGTPSGVPLFQAAPATVSPYRPSSNADLSSTDYEPQQHVSPVMSTAPKSSHINHQRDLAYKPNLAQGWKAPGVTLPKVCEKLQQQVIFDQQHQLQVSQQHKEHNESYYEQQRFINETVNTCELFNSKDEDEIINYVKNDRQVQDKQQYIKWQQLQNNQEQIDQLTPQKFDNHWMRSAESLSSPMPTQCLLVYDNAVQELQQQQQRQWQQANSHLNNNKRDIEMETSKNCVNVSNQLQQIEQERLVRLHREQSYDHPYEYQQQQQQHLQVLKEQQLILEQKIQQLQNQQQTQYDTINDINAIKTSSTQNEKDIKNETFEKISVHDLIKEFEKQSAINDQLIIVNKKERKQYKKDSSVNNAELYVPKEIPLDSYAPPPTVDFKNSGSRSSGIVNPSNYQSTQFNQYDQYNKFPIIKQDNEQAGFLSTTSNVTAPAKENYWTTDSFQTVPQKSSQNAASVNFNPSPLSYDKLAKFENPDPQSSQQYGTGTYYSPPSSRQHLYPLTNGKYPNRNVSPIPFGSTGTRSGYLPASTSVSPRPFLDEHYYANNSPLPTSNCNVTARNLLNAPNYNKAARGWNIGSIQTQPNYSIQSSLNKPKPMPVTGNMPYTDF